MEIEDFQFAQKCYTFLTFEHNKFHFTTNLRLVEYCCFNENRIRLTKAAQKYSKQIFDYFDGVMSFIVSKNVAEPREIKL